MVDYNPDIAWEVPSDPSLKEFLEPTEYSDMDNPLVRDLALSLARNAEHPRTVAVKVWNYIVDEIKWCYEPPKPVLKVIQEKTGNCFNRTNLHASLLRINGIPARYTYEQVYSKFAGIAIPPSIIERLPVNAIVHATPEVYIDGRWIQCDQWADRDLIPYLYQWNGVDDLYGLPPDYVWKNLGYSPGILLEPLKAQFKNAGITKKFCVENVDPYTDFVRNLPYEEKVSVYESILGEEYADNFARYLYIKAVPFRETECEDIKPSEPSRLPIQDSIIPR